jgi:hypothetical protein
VSLSALSQTRVIGTLDCITQQADDRCILLIMCGLSAGNVINFLTYHRGPRLPHRPSCLPPHFPRTYSTAITQHFPGSLSLITPSFLYLTTLSSPCTHQPRMFRNVYATTIIVSWSWIASQQCKYPVCTLNSNQYRRDMRLASC